MMSLDRDPLTLRYWQARNFLELKTCLERFIMLTPYKNPPPPSGALVSLSYQDMQDGANALWNLVALSDECKKSTVLSLLHKEAIEWIDKNHNSIQAIHDKFLYCMKSLDEAAKAGG
jgi:hypothetical protein